TTASEADGLAMAMPVSCPGPRDKRGKLSTLRTSGGAASAEPAKRHNRRGRASFFPRRTRRPRNFRVFRVLPWQLIPIMTLFRIHLINAVPILQRRLSDKSPAAFQIDARQGVSRKMLLMLFQTGNGRLPLPPSILLDAAGKGIDHGRQLLML